jgi:signal peptidase I
MAVCESVMFWGMGHFLAGYGRRGMRWLLTWMGMSAVGVVALAIPAISPALLVIAPVTIILTLAMFADAFMCGRRSQRKMLGAPVLRYLSGIGLFLVGYTFQVALGRFVILPMAGAMGVKTYVIESAAMNPTLRAGDRMLTNRTDTVRRWDLVVFHPPVTPKSIFPGRVVGLPGEKVEIVKGGIVIDDKPVPTPSGVGPYVDLHFGALPGVGVEGHPITLGPDEYFILGDNSPVAYDARIWGGSAPGHQRGAVPRNDIERKVTAIYFPLSRIRRFH